MTKEKTQHLEALLKSKAIDRAAYKLSVDYWIRIGVPEATIKEAWLIALSHHGEQEFDATGYSMGVAHGIMNAAVEAANETNDTPKPPIKPPIRH